MTSKINGNSIFLPAAGCRNGKSTYNANHRGNYWSSSLNSVLQNEAVFINLYLDSDFKYVDQVDRNYGLSMRPVCP